MFFFPLRKVPSCCAGLLGPSVDLDRRPSPSDSADTLFHPSKPAERFIPSHRYRDGVRAAMHPSRAPVHGSQWGQVMPFNNGEVSIVVTCPVAFCTSLPPGFQGVANESDVHWDDWTESKLVVVAAKVLPEHTKRPTRLLSPKVVGRDIRGSPQSRPSVEVKICVCPPA